jgi:predicted 3-demethylubiquinone-9 3-methyltransferase (glyoxalase superfamily)
MSQKIVTNLWFDTEAEEAAEFYCSVFKDSKILGKLNYTEGTSKAGEVVTVDWELNGQRFTGINGGPQFKFDEAISLLINCADQDEVDYYWEKLTADGGSEGQCGWCKDRFGLSWQVIPEGMEELLGDSDPKRADRAMQAMLKMGKLDVAALRNAAASASAD